MKKLLLNFIYNILAKHARFVIANHNPFVIMITGSVGKTTTKEAVAKVLRDQYGDEVRVTPGNLNAEIGIPLTILGYKQVPNKFLWPIFLIFTWARSRTRNYPKYLILEVGIENPGDMAFFTSIVRPDIAILTSTNGAHLAHFPSLERYQEEKAFLLKALKPNGRVIINSDDEYLSRIKNDSDQGNFTSVAIFDERANYRVDNYKVTLAGTEYRIASTGHKISIKTKVLGQQNIYAQLIAFAVADIFSIQFLKTKESIEGILPEKGRMNLVEGAKHTVIIDDTYNANPASVTAALDTMAGIKYPSRKVFIMGTMNDLGDYSLQAHKNIAVYASNKIDVAIFAGKYAKLMVECFEGKGRAVAFKDRKELERHLPRLIKSNDLILIKASQNGNYFEEITKLLMEDPNQANNLLVRQTKFWLRKK